jgi:dTDP-D-glucose 4,6-dehydratase
MVKRVLITGGAGFIAHHLIDHLIRNTEWEVVVLDKLTYAANGLDRLREIGAYGLETGTGYGMLDGGAQHLAA